MQESIYFREHIMRFHWCSILALLLSHGISGTVDAQHRYRDVATSFDPADRKTFGISPSGNGGNCIQVIVRKIDNDTADLRTFTSEGDVKEAATYHFVDELLIGKINERVNESYSFALSDIKVDDVLSISYREHDGKRYVMCMEIHRRPTGDIPPSRNLPKDRRGYHEMINVHDRYYYNQERVPEEELRRNNMILQAVILYGEKDGDDKWLANRKIYNDEDLELAMCRDAKWMHYLGEIEKDRIDKLKAVEAKEAAAKAKK